MSDDLVVTRSVRIPRRELDVSFSASGGPGGQHANKNATRVDLRFDVDASSTFSEAQRDRVRSRLGSEVRVSADDERSQLRNRELAEQRLADRLREALRVERKRKATKPTKGSKRRRLEAKKQHGEKKRQRRKPTRNDW
ncbi:MAG: aminoacyl-tRNA hydrolase [Acidimicrobiaceae bacterium]|nr:aminoacyl-tRNA hydrolase [Acidimicrobiaceae bacterium]